ncbi:Rossmann-like and DUF2520 domain-containing protein [Hyphobacterium sp.]|uniref:Rossmann-like and DUF2520 domain-containing protein n=1 Tax=Hyphobacterium sp. TaxID=2004662 RepID=UPI003BAB243F
MKDLAIIGPGKVGRTLALLFHEKQVFKIGALIAEREATAKEAAGFIGAGEPGGTLSDADVILIAVPDPVLETVISGLIDTDLKPGAILAHTSGALGLEMFAPLQGREVRTVCAHPVKAFSETARSVDTFTGTMTTLSGDASACSDLAAAFRAIGGQTLEIPANTDRTLYHAGIVFMANHLPTLVEAGLKTFEQAGVSRKDGLAITGPILRDTLEAVLENGPAAALTGPVARGDANTVARHLEKISRADTDLAALYAALAHATADVSKEKGEASADGLAAIRALTKPVG